MTSLIRPLEARNGADRYLYDAELVGEFSAELFDPVSSRDITAVHGLQMGRGGVRFFAFRGRDLVLRHYRRGGLVRHLVADLYPGLRPDGSRSFREWRLLAELWRLGLPVPRPVAAAFRPCGLLYRADLVTCQLHATRSLSSLVRQPVDNEVWSRVGLTLRRFHDAQVFHADLNAHNILLDERQAYLIDFDRGAIRSGQAWKQANLARLKRSLDKISAGYGNAEERDTGWQMLLDAYRQTS